MPVDAVGGTSAAPEVFDEMAVLAEGIGPAAFLIGTQLASQGRNWSSGAEQAFGKENPAKQAENIDIA